MEPINELVQEECNTIFKLKKISYTDLKNNHWLYINLKNWIKWWEFDVFSSIIKDIDSNNSKFDLFVIYLEKDIIGFITNHTFIQNSNSTATPWIKINLIMNPAGILHKSNEICYYLIQLIENDLLDFLFENNLTFIKDFAYIFIEFPISSNSELFLRNWKKNIKMNSNWSYHIYPLDEIITNNDNEKIFRDTAHIFYYNPQFHAVVPNLIKIKYDKALMVYQSLKNLKNPFNGVIHEKFEKVLETKRFYNEISPQILLKLHDYKKKRDELWGQYSLQQNENQLEKYIKTMESDIDLLCSYGFRFNIFNPHSEKGFNLLNSIQNALILNNFESIQSQGSVFQSLITDDGIINPDFFKIDSLLKLTNEFGGFIEYELNQNNGIFIGYACGSYKKKEECYSKQLICTLIFLEIFRGFSLAGLLAFIGMLAVIEKFDIMYEDATILNKNTHNLVKRLGFNTYGITKNRYYSPSKDLPNELKCVGMARTYFINPILTFNHNLKETNPNNSSLLLFQNLKQKLINHQILKIVDI